MERTLRPNQYRRMIGNEWVAAETVFITGEEWHAITDPTLTPVFQDHTCEAFVGIDASTKHDSTARAAVAWDSERKKLKLINLQVFQPSVAEPLDFERTIERTLLRWSARYQLREGRCDPWQMSAPMQTLRRAGINVVEFAQTPANLSAMATSLYELVRSRTLSVYEDAALRRAVAQAVAVESARGWKIDKSKQSHKTRLTH